MKRQEGVYTTLTHREFRTTSEAQVVDADSGLVTAVSNAYEQAAFAANVDIETATEAVEAAAALISQTDDS
jgi:hypothetical protein